jgi:hypothetical protein
MHEATRWTESDLIHVIHGGQAESVNLEFKSSGALQRNDRNKKELARDVTALANSAGGVIVYGIREVDGGRFELDEGVEPVERFVDWIEDVLSSIQQRIDSLHVHSVPLETRSPGREAIVVYVPQSPRAPHQAADYRFYKRHGARVLPMEEYEIRDVSRRQLACDLHVNVVFGPELGIPHSALSGLQRHADLNLRLTNTSEQLAEYASVDFWVDHRLDAVRIPYASNVIEPIGPNPTSVFARHIIIPFNGRNGIPVFRGAPVYATTDPIRVAVPADGVYVFKWAVHAPMMRPRTAYGLLTWEDNGCDVSHVELGEDELPWQRLE